MKNFRIITLLALILSAGLVGCDNNREPNGILKASYSLARSSAIFGYRQAKAGLTEQQMLVELEKTFIKIDN